MLKEFMKTKKIPKLYETENQQDPIAYVKFFTPDSCWSWFVTEYDPDQDLCFGLVIGFETEFGYFSLQEIETSKGPLGLKIERDIYFSETHLSAIREETIL